jgi:hypothetical protein
MDILLHSIEQKSGFYYISIKKGNFGSTLIDLLINFHICRYTEIFNDIPPIFDDISIKIDDIVFQTFNFT